MAGQLSRVSEATDAELAEWSLHGDLDAYSTLVSRYHARVFQTIYGMVGDRDDADDLAQETFIKAHRSLAQFKGHSQFYTWIYRIAVNQSLDWMKSRKRRRIVGLEHAEGDPVGRIEGTDSRILSRELNEHLDAALDRLAPEYRAAVVMREIDGRSYEEIARLLSCSVGTVKSRLFRARQHLRRMLDDVYGEVNHSYVVGGSAPR